MDEMSTALVVMSPATCRWPSTSTRVRARPRVRRSMELTPAPLPKLFELARTVPDTPTAGSWLMMSPRLCGPAVAIIWVESTATGVGWSRFGRGIRVPVTTISSTAGG